MSKERGLTRSLKYQANKCAYPYSGKPEIPYYVGKVGVDYPYSEVEHASYDDIISPGVWDSYETLKTLFNPESMPPAWHSFIKSVNRAQKETGFTGPVNLAWGISFLAEDCPLAKKYGLEEFGLLNTGETDFRDAEKIKNSINIALAKPKLRKELRRIMSVLSPDMSASYVSTEKLVKFLERAGVTSGILAELGCGLGLESVNFAKNLKMQVVGMERQYHERWYPKFWVEARKEIGNLDFVRGDFAQALPFAEGSVDAAVMERVVPHVTHKSLENGLREVLRVLKPGGLFFVGPENTKDYSGWRILRKEVTDSGTEYEFKRVNYYSLVPEDRIKWKRRKKIRP